MPSYVKTKNAASAINLINLVSTNAACSNPELWF